MIVIQMYDNIYATFYKQGPWSLRNQTII